jgi:hypothetical protein
MTTATPTKAGAADYNDASASTQSNTSTEAPKPTGLLTFCPFVTLAPADPLSERSEKA